MKNYGRSVFAAKNGGSRMRGKRIDGFPTREQALRDFFEAWTPHDGTELVPLEQAAGRITAKELRSANTLPVYRVSACDGIAVDSSKFADGVPDCSGWHIGQEFARADTGDDFEDRFDAVIPIEEVDLTEENRIAYLSPDLNVVPGFNVFPRGSTLMAGDRLIGANLPLRPTDLASLAMGGISMVPVWKKPKVAFIPTGSELIPQGMHPKRGENVDTNSILVQHTLQEMGAEPIVFPIVPDVTVELKKRLDEALSVADIVVINAGTAKGGEDYNYSLLGQEGKLIHHYIAAAPGRPLALAVIGSKPVINLPGPTIAAFFGMDWCVRAAVDRFLHIPLQKRPHVRGVLMEDIRSTPQMAILCRMNAVRTPDGCELYPLSFHDSMAMCMASNAMYVCDVGESGRDKGEILEVELLRGEEYLEGSADGI
jgi:molybdopterin molybdotransferase